MAGTIHYDNDTKEAHKLFISWLNQMLNDYITSFYDDAIKNIISLTFIKQHHSFIQELYQGDGRSLSAFMTMLPTNTTNFLLMVHDIGNGVPKMYNDSDGTNLFEFDSEGRLIRFYENVTIDLYDAKGEIVGECYIAFEDWYGIKCPMYYVKEKNTNSLIGKGLLDVQFEGFSSGSYLVQNKPLKEHDKFAVTNISNITTIMDVPVLTDFNIRYEIKSKRTIFIPVTEWTSYYFEKAEDLGGLRIIKYENPSSTEETEKSCEEKLYDCFKD